MDSCRRLKLDARRQKVQGSQSRKEQRDKYTLDRDWTSALCPGKVDPPADVTACLHVQLNDTS